MNEAQRILEDSPATLPLEAIHKDSSSPNAQWQDFNGKVTTQNSKLLLLMVEYVQDPGNNETDLCNYSTGVLESGKVNSCDSNLTSSGRYSPIYNTLLIPSNGQSQFSNSLLVLPSAKDSAQEISIVVDECQVPGHLVLQQQKKQQTEALTSNTEKLSSDSSQPIAQPPTSDPGQTNSQADSIVLNEKLVVASGTVVDHLGEEIDLVNNSNTFFEDEKCKVVSSADFQVSNCDNLGQNTFPLHSGNNLIHLSDLVGGESKILLGSSKFVIDGDNLKNELHEDELLLSSSVQNNELLMRSEALLEVDSFSLTQTAYITTDNGSAFAAVDEQLNIENLEKVGNDYLLPEFDDTDPNLLQSSLEAFTPDNILDNNGLLLTEKTRHRQGKKTEIEHPGNDYWCESCEFGIKCEQHKVKVVPDKPVLSRARATLPKELLSINKLRTGTDEEGVFARKTIMRRVQFGPVEGRLVQDEDKQSHNEGRSDAGSSGGRDKDTDSVKLSIELDEGQLVELDVSGESETNWMRFVRKAKTLKEQNLILTQQGKCLYFTTTRVIPPKHELKVGYSPQYAERRKLDILDDLPWNCCECATKFPSSEELQKHLKFHKMNVNINGKRKNKVNSNRGLTCLNDVKIVTRNRNQNERVMGKERECWTCHKVFPRAYSLKRHLSLVHSEKNKENSGFIKNRIENCEKLPISNTLFKKKQSTGTGSEWLCTHCNLTFSNSSVLNLHTLTHAAEDLESEADAGLSSELASAYQEGDLLVDIGDVQCPQCTQEFPSKRQLIDHVSTHGKMSLTKLCPNPSKSFKCDRCYKSFATDIRLQKHMLVHGSEETKPYRCDTCFKRFLNNSALSCHIKTHSDKKCFECPLCKKEFKQVFGLKEHVKIHSTDGYYTCPHCNKVFDGYSVVRKHIRAFHSGLQHECKDCGKLFPTVDKLRMHSLKHSDHREFLCANCGKQFKRKDKLKEHMRRMHSAEREKKLMSLALRIPNIKDRRFIPKVSPLAYDRFIYKCRNCMVGFKRRGMLVNHLAKRHPDIIPNTVPELNLPILKTTRDYFCQYCDKIYKSSSKRKAHILKNHPGAELPMSNRQKGGVPQIPGVPNPTFSQTVGSVKTNPHGCKWCHKQYASKAKLLQHQRKKHMSLLPQAQQVPRPPKNPNSPIGNKAMAAAMSCSRSGETTDDDLMKMDKNPLGIVQGDDYNVEFVQDGNPDDKKSGKEFAVNISNDLLQQAMTEFNHSFTDYKLPFTGVQDNILKIIGLKDGGDGGLGREENLALPPSPVQMAQTWPELPPYPPR